MRERLASWLALLAVLVMAVAVVGLDAVVGEPATSPGRAVRTSADPVAGSWVCGVGSADDGRRLTHVLVPPGTPDGPPADVEIERFTEGERDVDQRPPLAAGFDERITFRAAEDELSASIVRWRGAPTALWREWNLEDDDDLPDSTVAGPCAQSSSPTWIVPGMSTEGGDEARLRLANPFGSAATLGIRFLTPDGEVGPLALGNLTVPAGSVREVVVNEVLPEEADLAAFVDVVTGRLSVEGIQITRPAIGGVAGASLLAAAQAPAEQWTVPWIADTSPASSWLWIANPGSQPATVELTFHTDDGGVVPTGLAEAGVPAGQVRRVDVTGTLPDDVGVVAVTARSNGVPVVISAGTRLVRDEVSRTGLVVQLGATAPDDLWMVAGTARYVRQEELHVVNPTGVAAQVDVALLVGTEQVEPSALQDVAVPAGSSRTLPLTEHVGDGGWTALVSATEGEVVVGRVARTPEDDGPLRLVVAPAQPSSSWEASDSGLDADASTRLVRQLRTSLGLGERR